MTSATVRSTFEEATDAGPGAPLGAAREAAAPGVLRVAPGRRSVTLRVARRARVLGATAAAALLLAGCQITSPIQTQIPYDPADGVSVELGDVKIRDLLIVAAAQNAPGLISGLVVNEGREEVAVSIGTAEGSPVTANVKPLTSMRLSGGSGQQSSLPSVSVAPGGMVELNVATPGAGTQRVLVPVLAPQRYYSTVTVPGAPPPTSATPTSTSTEGAGDHMPPEHAGEPTGSETPAGGH